MGGGLILNPASGQLQLGATVYGGPALARCQCCRGINGTPPATIYVTFHGIAACAVGEVVGNGPILNGNVYALTLDPAYCDGGRFDYYNQYEYHCRWRYTDSEVDVIFQHYTSGAHYEGALGRVVDMQIGLSARTYGYSGFSWGWRSAFNYHQYALHIPLCFADAPSLNVAGGCVYDDSFLLAHGHSGFASWRAHEYEPWVLQAAYNYNDMVVHNGVFYICIAGHPIAWDYTEPGVGLEWWNWWAIAPPCPPPRQWVGGRAPMFNSPYYPNPGSVWHPAHIWVSNNDVWYRTSRGHWGLAENEPGVGANWQSHWVVLP
jgi:hypothetical protein